MLITSFSKKVKENKSISSILSDAFINLMGEKFDEKRYYKDYKDVKKSRYKALEHFFHYGWLEGREAYTLTGGGFKSLVSENIILHLHKKTELNQQEYQYQSQVIANFIDSAFYNSQLEDPLPAELLRHHYLCVGRHQGIQPCVEFSIECYLSKYEDIAHANIDPFYHYCVAGFNEGRLALSLTSLDDIKNLSSDMITRLTAQEFNEEYYIDSYEDISSYEGTPFQHYVSNGWKEGRYPSLAVKKFFSDQDLYRLISEGIPPVVIMLLGQRGHLSGLEDCEVKDLALYGSMGRQRADAEPIINALQEFVDQDYYYSLYPDVQQADMSAVEHYCLFGWKEGKDPCLDFSTKFYLQDNFDVQEAGINPFYHYIVAGQYERRYGKQPGGHKASRIWDVIPISETVVNWKLTEPNDHIVQDLSFLDTDKKYALVFSHDDYIQNTGGIQKCLNVEQEVALSRGLVYFHLSPYQPSPILAEEHSNADNFFYRLLVDGEFLGYICHTTLQTFLLNSSLVFERTIFHAFQGLSPELMLQLVEAVQNGNSSQVDTYLWIHDSFTLCPSFTLQRNGVDFCGAPNQNSQACNLCVFGEERSNHRSRLIRLFKALPETRVICPSEFTKTLWQEKSEFGLQNVFMVPHMSLIPSSPRSHSQSTKIAFVGFPHAHKGWADFERLVFKNVSSLGVEFLHIGSIQSDISHLPFLEVNVTNENPNGMIEAIKNENVDIVLLPSDIPETFNYVCHEAIIAGAAVVTYENSGNIARAVELYGQGLVVEGLNELMSVVEDINNGRTLGQTYYHTFTYSDMRDRKSVV